MSQQAEIYSRPTQKQKPLLQDYEWLFNFISIILHEKAVAANASIKIFKIYLNVVYKT